MKKHSLSLLAALLLILSLGAWASAAPADGGIYVTDAAGILRAGDCAALNEAAAAVSGQYGCGVYIVTVSDMADYIDPDAVTATGEIGIAAFGEYAWDALALGDRWDGSGVVLVLSMAERDFDLTARGDTANAAFTDYGKSLLQDEFLDDFRVNDWYGGFSDYIAACGRYLEASANGAPIDVEPKAPLTLGEKLVRGLSIGLPLGLVLAFLLCAILKGQLKSVGRAREAARYTVSGGTRISTREDRFTHITQVRTPIRTESKPSGGGDNHFSGGTSVNSGGFSHSSGKF